MPLDGCGIMAFVVAHRTSLQFPEPIDHSAAGSTLGTAQSTSSKWMGVAAPLACRYSKYRAQTAASAVEIALAAV